MKKVVILFSLAVVAFVVGVGIRYYLTRPTDGGPIETPPPPPEEVTSEEQLKIIEGLGEEDSGQSEEQELKNLEGLGGPEKQSREQRLKTIEGL